MMLPPITRDPVGFPISSTSNNSVNDIFPSQTGLIRSDNLIPLPDVGLIVWAHLINNPIKSDEGRLDIWCYWVPPLLT